MATLTIPTFEDPFFTMTLALEGRPYVFDFRFNQREAAWYFSIELEDGTPLASGIKVVCGIDLLKYRRDVRLPQGLLTAIASGDDTSPPGLLELGEDKRVSLTYFPSNELGT